MATALEEPVNTIVIDDALEKVTSRDGMGVYASADTLFKGAVFGRDSLEVAEDLMGIKPQLVERVLVTLASLQGLSQNDANEEEPGKIVHEFRTIIVDGEPLDNVSQVIFDELYGRWGGKDDSLAYYGSVDATPHFLRAMAAYISEHNPEFLKTAITRRDGSVVTLKDSVQAATDWVLSKLESSQSGLIEYCRKNPDGIQNQVWKDSAEFYVHTNGTLANHDRPIASIEVQGLAYDGLLAAADLLAERNDELIRRAEDLRDRTIDLLWLPQSQYFALGVDFDSTNQMRIIETKTANPAALLDTKFFDALEAADREKYVSAVVKTIVSNDFLTDAGIRSRALSDAHTISFWDYHGSFVSWPKETYDIAKGLRRQGFPNLAGQLENRLLNVTKRSGIFPEFFYIDAEGRVLFAPRKDVASLKTIEVDSTNRPESVQAWTVSATMGSLADTIHGPAVVPAVSKWQLNLESKLMNQLLKMDLLNETGLEKRYPYYTFKLIRDKSKSFSNFLHQKLES